MVFSSPIFLFYFLPVVLALHLMTRDVEWRNRVLLAASLFFYAWGEPVFVFVLAGSAFIAYMAGRAMEAGHHRRLALAGAVLWHLGMLVLAKYWDFLITELGGAAFGLPALGIALPLGVSFFTFQSISYLVDVYRGQAPVVRRFDVLLLYISMFPQLIAGPIVRHDEIIHQYAASPLRAGLHERLSRGLVLLVIGLVKKVFIADNLALIADPLFATAAQGGSLTLGEGWTAAGAFGLQIYFDFSGYSDMAIGLGLMFGFTLPDNFNAPYRACSIREFWRRWHMTLSRFLRDYLYIPLGGNRRGAARLIVALVVTMLLGGLWHGAAWTFVVWGGLHGLALSLEYLWRRTGLALPAAAGWAATMLFVFVTWVLFRAETFGAAIHILSAMAGGNGWALSVAGAEGLWLIAVAALVATLGPTARRAAEELLKPRSYYAYAVAAALVLVLLRAGGGDTSDFIYFQF
ncbi:MAG: MBOAT family protein [Proteobacteria bacterium]|nr:MBOAT family protein [Pseudomonadota bacterium]